MFVGLPLAILLAPVWLTIGLVADCAQRLFRLPTIRLGVFGVVYLAHEWAGLLASVYIGARGRLRAGTGPRPKAEQLEPYRRVQAWWATSLLHWADRLLGVRLDFPDPRELPAGSFVLLSRHASMVDAVVPIHLIGHHLDRFVHYVIKRELQLDPNLDVFGNRLDNHFVTRQQAPKDEAIAIARMASEMLPRSVLVIFPEGTYATPENRARALASLTRARGEQQALAEQLDHLLPPRPAGTLAMLNAQPDLDVVVLGHVGLEGVANLSGLRRRLPLRDPVVIRWWHHDRRDLDANHERILDWLNDQWRTLDAWVDAEHRRRATGRSSRRENP